MLRIGLIGTESTHARLFIQRILKRSGEAVVSAVLEDGDGSGQKLAQEYGLPLVHSLEEMAEVVDAAMIFYRRRDRHYDIARFMLQRGKSVWLDKPFTHTVAQAQQLYDLARAQGVAFTGGSTLRFSRSVEQFGQRFHACEDALAAGFNHVGRADSVYDGIAFYGPHTLSILQTAFGPDVKSISAVRQGRSLAAFARYEDTVVSMQLADCFESVGEIYTTERIERFALTSENAFDLALEEFLTLCREGTVADYDTLIAPVALLNALERALASGREEQVEKWRR